MAFAEGLPLVALRPDAERADEMEDQPPRSTAIIVHPLSMYSGGATSLIYSPADWLRAAVAFRRDEMQRLIEHRQQQQQLEDLVAEPKPAPALLDYTCDENVRSILGFLDGVSLCRARRVNRYFHRLGGSEDFWFNLCRAEWCISPEQLTPRPASFQELYKYACRSLKVLIRDLVEEQCLTSLQASFRIPREAAVMITRGASTV
jgi:hypothetical protein